LSHVGATFGFFLVAQAEPHDGWIVRPRR